MKDMVVRVSGSLSVGAGDAALHSKVRVLCEEGYNVIFLEMGGVTYMDSSAVGELVAAFTSAQNRSCHLALVNVPPRIEKILRVMAFMDIFKVFTSLEDAKQVMTREVAGEA